MTADEAERDVLLASILEDLTDQVHRGETVDLDQVITKHPDLAQDLRELWGAVMLTDAVANTYEDSIDLSLTTSASGGSSAGGLRALQLPAVFGDYELLEEIGRGGMGVVYRAKQTSLNRVVAIKMVLKDKLASAEDLARFQAEAEATARLEHSGIVPVYEVGEYEGRYYFSMKYVEGETLADRIAQGPMPPREAAMMLKEIALAVHHAHHHGILHRDLKPSNILLDAAGKPLVTDFGLAKQFKSNQRLTNTGAILGTPAYMAPEQASGSRGQVGPASDVYSLGTVLYAMLTGRPPFQGATPVEIVLQVLEQDPPLPREINPKVNRDLEMIALRCLQKPIDLRYSDAQALADDLDAYLKDESISARSGQFLQIVSRLFRETHNAQILENWGVLWMWHSLVLVIICVMTHFLQQREDQNMWQYIGIWTVLSGIWAAAFWAMRRRMGPVTFIERQIAHVWGASLIGISCMFPLEWLMGLEVLTLSPLLAVMSGMIFLIKGGILTGWFYIQAAALFLTAIPMALYPEYAHLIFGAVASLSFFVPGYQYHQQKLRGEKLLSE
ncbi:MAG: protein kinase [Blastopirellula sp.]|nr:MAG: protein kinase [Blastopirellula sp.]